MRGGLWCSSMARRPSSNAATTRTARLAAEWMRVGFVHGVAVILVCGQLGKLTGVPIDADKPIGQVADLLQGRADLSVATLVTGLVALAFLFGLKAVAPKLPSVAMVPTVLKVPAVEALLMRVWREYSRGWSTARGRCEPVAWRGG